MQPHRVDVAFGGLVPAGHVVPQVQPPPGRDGGADPDGQLLGPVVGEVDLHRDLGADRGGFPGRGLQLGDQPGQGRPVLVPVPRHLGQHPERHEERAGFVDREPQRAAHGFGLADHDLAALIGQVDREVGVGGAQLHAPQQVQVVDQLALTDPEGRRRLGQPDHLPADHVRHQGQQPLQPLRRGDRAHARTPLRRAMTASRRSGGSRTTASGPKRAA